MASDVPRMIAVPPNVPQPDSGPIQPILSVSSAMAPAQTRNAVNAEVNRVERKRFMVVLPFRWTGGPSFLWLWGPGVAGMQYSGGINRPVAKSV